MTSAGEQPRAPLASGTDAPDFALRSTPDQTLSLSDAQLVGISVDGGWCHQAFARDRNLHFPLLADFEPKREVSRAYGAYRAPTPVAVNPGAYGILHALEKLGDGGAA